MKRIMIKKVFIVVLLSFSTFLFAAGKSTMYVKIKTAQVKEKSSKKSKSSGTIPYGASVTVLNSIDGWYYISCDKPKIVGWVASSSLSRKNVNGRGKVSSANAKELALAGKGLTASIESTYADTENVDFSEVNKIETISVSDEEVYQFIINGELNSEEQE